MTKQMVAKFAGQCKDCGCHIPAGRVIRWKQGVGVFHITSLACDEAKAERAAAQGTAAPAADAPTKDVAPIVAFLRAAQGRGLKFPSVRFIAPGGGELRLYIATERAKVPGAMNVLVRGEWIGRINPNGEIVGRGLVGNVELLDAMDRIAANPATEAAAFGKLTGCCSFCDRKLEDAGSVEVGYGPVCAKRYDLPHVPKGTPAMVAA